MTLSNGKVNGQTNGNHSHLQKKWWKDGVVYQIYPASFKDSNDDGLGDLPGIISKLDYIRDLGTDTIWLSPMYDSPQVDMGYDISDYEAIYPPYGSLEDMMTLINETHARGMRIIVDLVINHTSDQHAWFKEARSSKDNPKRDWYIFRPPRYDDQGRRMPPNNWRSCFSQPAWTWDETTQEYYLHLFCPEQPDLNWENPVTRKAIYASAIEFWLDRGVDGFRVDTVNLYSKGDLADAPVTDNSRDDQPAADKFCNGPRMHEFLREINDTVYQKYGDVMTVGELGNCSDFDHVLRYISSSDPQLSMVFQMDIVNLGSGVPAGKPKFEYTPYRLSEFKRIWTVMQNFIVGTDGWTTAFAENHDQGRSVSRFADDSPEFREISSKMMAALLCASSGTLFVYQGQEIGMINAPESWDLDEYLDVDTQNYVKFVKDTAGDDPKALEETKKGLQVLARDHSRLPMQWDATSYGGFSRSKPWMRVHDLYKEINVKMQEHSPHSVLNYWRHVIDLRKQYRELFIYGESTLVDPENEDTFVFIKSLPSATDGRQAVVALNFTSEEKDWAVPDRLSKGEGKLLTSNYAPPTKVNDKLKPWEARIYLA